MIYYTYTETFYVNVNENLKSDRRFLVIDSVNIRALNFRRSLQDHDVLARSLHLTR